MTTLTTPTLTINIAGLLLTRCTICGRYDIGQPLGACAICGGRRRLATVGELFEGDGQDADGKEPTAMDRQDVG